MAETARDTATEGSFRPASKSRRPRQTSYAVRMTLAGHVQGVGFRPFVYRLAREYGLTGYVQNRLGEVDIVACGHQQVLQKFRDDLIRRAPPLSRPRIIKILPIDTAAFSVFEIIDSANDADARIYVPADYFMCEDCREELLDPDDRRFGYPFINCTQCGPRYTLIERLPYDRLNTSMAEFPLCSACEAEYR
ncbi:MAG: acylphosphatase, partial [Gammaproteobacteria bacterium]|nr:acylphosphatase [Gammaproteobacteria bacterium]